MWYYNKIDISKGIDINKTNSSYEYKICHSSYFFKINFHFQPNVCGGCHFLLKPISSNETGIISLK